jgi:LemA protein
MPTIPRRNMTLWIVGGVILLLVIMGISYHNSFVTKRNAIDAQWHQVEVQYQRRVDLIPNLVATAKGAQIQEQKVFGDVSQARQNYLNASGTDAKAAAAGQVETSLGRLLAVVEAYPQLNSYQNLLSLQDELAGTENRVAVERKRYNDDVQDYKNSIQKFPGSLFAGLFGVHDTSSYFEADAGSSVAPKVDFN